MARRTLYTALPVEMKGIWANLNGQLTYTIEVRLACEEELAKMNRTTAVTVHKERSSATRSHAVRMGLDTIYFFPCQNYNSYMLNRKSAKHTCLRLCTVSHSFLFPTN